MPAPPARITEAQFVPLAQLYAHHAVIEDAEGERYEPQTWSEIDVVQWTARRPGARATYRIPEERLGDPDSRAYDRRDGGGRRTRRGTGSPQPRAGCTSMSSPGSRRRSGASPRTRTRASRPASTRRAVTSAGSRQADTRAGSPRLSSSVGSPRRRHWRVDDLSVRLRVHRRAGGGAVPRRRDDARARTDDGRRPRRDARRPAARRGTTRTQRSSSSARGPARPSRTRSSPSPGCGARRPPPAGRLLGAGLHPDGRFGDATLVEGHRYEFVADQLRGLLRRTPESALHVHVGLPDERTAARAFNAMRLHVPLLVGLAANSPFWFGTELGSLQRAATCSPARTPGAASRGRCATSRTSSSSSAETLTAAGLPDPTFLWWDLRHAPAARHARAARDGRAVLARARRRDRRARTRAGDRGRGRPGAPPASRARRSTGRPSGPPETARTRRSSTATSRARWPTSRAMRFGAFGPSPAMRGTRRRWTPSSAFSRRTARPASARPSRAAGCRSSSAGSPRRRRRQRGPRPARPESGR